MSNHFLHAFSDWLKLAEEVLLMNDKENYLHYRKINQEK